MAYPWQDLSPTDFYSVNAAGSSFSIESEKVLTFLYQPIIGEKAFLLYKVFQNNEILYSNSEYLPHSTLFTILDMGVKDFYQARIRLEAVGLLKTKKNKKNNDVYYHYYLQEPFSSKVFFDESVLRVSLFEMLGETNYQRIYRGMKKDFYPEENDDFEDISKSFTDVFRFNPSPEVLEKDQKITQSKQLARQKNGKVDIDQSSFDWEFFTDKISSRFVNRKYLETREIKNSILTLHHLYNIDELAMENFVLEVSDVTTGKVDVNKLEKNIHHTMNQKGYVSHKNKLADIVTEHDQTIQLSEEERVEELKKQGFNEQEISIIRSSEKNNSMEFLEKIKRAQRTNITKSERVFVTDLVNQTQLTEPVINILIHYVLVQQDNNLFIGENYLYSIVNSWVKKGINTPENALEQSKKFVLEAKEKKEASRKRQERRSAYSNQKVRKEILPDWAKEETSVSAPKLDQPVAQMDEETKNKFKQRLERIRKYREGGENSGD